MPGKQMSIDADLNAGLIDDREARRRRQEISREADFYGAMDGASKFVRGDAIAAIVIMAVNIIGGFLIGVLQRTCPSRSGDYVYHTDRRRGLVAQIPALIISTASGLIVIVPLQRRISARISSGRSSSIRRHSALQQVFSVCSA